MLVDVHGDRVVLKVGRSRKIMSMVQTSRLIGELAAALELTADEPYWPKPDWKIKAPGEGYAILPDGRRLEVVQTEKGWIGYIDEVALNPDTPAVRKRDAQNLVYNVLTNNTQ